MTLSAAAIAAMMGRLLPEGDIWATSDEYEDPTDLGRLLEAMAEEPARIENNYDLILEEVIPDNVNTDLDRWERIVGMPDTALSDAARLARIQSILNGNGEVNLPTLEFLAQTTAADPAVKLFNRIAPRCAVGQSNVGDHLFGGFWNPTWVCELMPNLVTDPDDFSGWTNLGSFAANAENSPVTFAATADTGVIQTASFTSLALAGTADDDTVYYSIWVKPGATPVPLELSLLQRDGSTSPVLEVTLPPSVWSRVDYEYELGAGGTTPAIQLRGVGGTLAVALSWAVAGVRDEDLEERIYRFFPLHTYGHFGVQGEYETLLGQPQDEATW